MPTAKTVRDRLDELKTKARQASYRDYDNKLGGPKKNRLKLAKFEV